MTSEIIILDGKYEVWSSAFFDGWPTADPERARYDAAVKRIQRFERLRQLYSTSGPDQQMPRDRFGSLPADEQSWCVVNGETGQVRNEALSRDDAIALASELNELSVG